MGRVVYLSETPPADGFKMWEGYPDCMSATQAADALGVSIATMRRLIATGALRVAHVGRAVRITKTALLEYIGEGVGNV